MKIFKRLLIVFLLLIFYITISAISYVSAVSENISDSIFRLHVIANSDSAEDQNLKLIVRDELLKYMNSLTKDVHSKEVAMKIAAEHKNDFYNIAKKTIEDNGFSYDVSINIDYCYFPTKQYGDISIPAGYYDALKVEIGSALGQNWWCVMFPPLCFVDMSTGIVPSDSKENIRNNLPEEEYALISTKDNSNINFKFKLVELIYNNNFFNF